MWVSKDDRGSREAASWCVSGRSIDSEGKGFDDKLHVLGRRQDTLAVRAAARVDDDNPGGTPRAHAAPGRV